VQEKILFVDDDPAILEALELSRRKKFNVVMANAPEAGLKAFAELGPFVVG